MRIACTVPAATEPVCVHVELIDDINMLRLVLRRLTEDPALRDRLGRAARRYWAEHATMTVMACDYETAIACAAAAPSPARPAGWPSHLMADGSSGARVLTAQVGVPYPLDQRSTGQADEMQRVSSITKTSSAERA
jgi:hypothetical protein